MLEKIKSRRGVYYDLEKSPYEFQIAGKTYKFSSKKKLDMFGHKLIERMDALDKCFKKIYRITDEGKDYSINELILKMVEKTYNEMLYK